MSSTIRTVVAVVAGFLVGSIINGGIVAFGPILIPPPPGVDMSTMESLAETIHLMGPLNFLVPFLAHALGTLTGATVACMIADTKRHTAVITMGIIFLIGGLAASVMIPAPVWFIVVDLLFAYIPMAWLGLLLSNRFKPDTHSPDSRN